MTSGRLYVGNLDYGATESDLDELFSEVGEIVSVEIVTNPRTQQSKGFAFVEMTRIEEAKRAVEVLHDQDFKGRKLLISGAKSKGPRERSSDGESRQRSERRPARERETREPESREPKPERKKPAPEEMAEITDGRLSVKNLDFEATESDLMNLFRGVGNVVVAEIATNPETQQSRGYGVVEMSHIDEARRAVEILHDKDFMGRKLRLGGAEEMEPAPVAAEPEPAPEATEPEATEPEATEPEATEPEATEPEATEPEATEPEATEPEATEPEATEPEATEPEATEPEATEPEATEPEATEPEATEPEATEPEATEPEATEPEAAEPEATEPEAAEPEAVAEESAETDKKESDSTAAA